MKVGYEEMAGMIKMLGFDGVELMVQPGGHIVPEHADLHLERAIEAMNGSGVDVYAVSTSANSPNDASLRIAIEWSGQMGVPTLRPGDWKFTAAEPEARLLEVQREISMLASMARQTGTTIAIHNGTAGLVGASVWDMYFLLRNLDQRLVGYDFDIGYAASQGDGWPTALRLALPRLKMVTAHDCYWSKDSGSWKLAECPLGEGMVDWPKFLAELAKAKYSGPISLQVGYEPKDEFAAIRKDQQFLRKQLAAAYG
jgi:sugar phosphate isomerase/epimerase